VMLTSLPPPPTPSLFTSKLVVWFVDLRIVDEREGVRVAINDAWKQIVVHAVIFSSVFGNQVCCRCSCQTIAQPEARIKVTFALILNVILQRISWLPISLY
jgi:hypothetical protein